MNWLDWVAYTVFAVVMVVGVYELIINEIKHRQQQKDDYWKIGGSE
jgi:hypothetical protein